VAKGANAPLKLGIPERRLPRELRLVEEHAAPVAEVLIPGDLPVALLRAHKTAAQHPKRSCHTRPRPAGSLRPRKNCVSENDTTCCARARRKMLQRRFTAPVHGARHCGGGAGRVRSHPAEESAAGARDLVAAFHLRPPPQIDVGAIPGCAMFSTASGGRHDTDGVHAPRTFSMAMPHAGHCLAVSCRRPRARSAGGGAACRAASEARHACALLSSHTILPTP